MKRAVTMSVRPALTSEVADCLPKTSLPVAPAVAAWADRREAWAAAVAWVDPEAEWADHRAWEVVLAKAEKVAVAAVAECVRRPNSPMNRRLMPPKLMPPKLKNPKLKSPKLKNPKLKSPKLKNPKLKNPKLKNPKPKNPKLKNPKPKNPKAEQVPSVPQTWIL
jgi:hypothetical protein